jgi:light-regulated signal transduction histidine kinase (bacteriophytochrome)
MDEYRVEGAERMFEMVKDLLRYARAVDDAEQPSNSVPANEAVSAALANLDDSVVAAGAKIEVASLPRVRVCENHLVQLFQNLLSNALKYRKSDVAPEIRVSALRDTIQWQFCVEDNGIGFNPEYSEKIFGVFKRLHQRNEYPGNGIGLAICARVVAHYGGRIWAESQSGQGAAFHFTLPAQQEGR